jgi:hypothetical protein
MGCSDAKAIGSIGSSPPSRRSILSAEQRRRGWAAAVADEEDFERFLSDHTEAAIKLSVLERLSAGRSARGAFGRAVSRRREAPERLPGRSRNTVRTNQ